MNATIQTLAVEALQAMAMRGELTPAQAVELLSECGGIPHTASDGAEVWIFASQPWDVEVMTSDFAPERCILWRRIKPE